MLLLIDIMPTRSAPWMSQYTSGSTPGGWGSGSSTWNMGGNWNTGYKPSGFNFGDVAGGVLGSGLSSLMSGLIGSGGSKSTTDSTTKRTWDQGLADQQVAWLQPDLNKLLEASGRGMQDFSQAKALLMQGMGPTDISEMKKNWGQLSNLGGKVYDPFRQAIGTYGDYRNQLAGAVDPASLMEGRMAAESEKQMAMRPGMTAAQRGAASFDTRGKMADAAAMRRGQEYAGATQGLAGAQQALGGAQLSGIQSAGQIAAQMSGIRAADMSRYIQGSALLSQMAMQNPEMAAIYAILGIKQGIQSQTMGQQQKQTTKQSGSGLLGALGL